MQTIETTIVVLPDGSIHIPPHPGLPPGEHRAMLVVEEAIQHRPPSIYVRTLGAFGVLVDGIRAVWTGSTAGARQLPRAFGYLILRRGQPVQRTPASERERATAALRAAGLLAEPSPAMQRLAAESTLTLEEARAILDRAGGKPLSELVLEMRGPKE